MAEINLTTPQKILAAFAIILTDLAARALLDKTLALAGDPQTIALWAQLQSIVELVSVVSMTGVLTGLTVMLAQVKEASEEPVLLRYALRLSLATSLPIAILVALTSPSLAAWLTQGRLSASLFSLAALIGCVTLLPATLNAYWLGKHQQQRMFQLALLTSLVLLAVALGAWLRLPISNLLFIQALMVALLGVITWNILRKKLPLEHVQNNASEHPNKLAQFVPVGLAIGIMSPVSMLLMRGILAQTLSWQDAGIMQALWRSTEWITATAAGVFSLIFLPRLSRTFGTDRFRLEIARSGWMVLIPTGCLLLIIYFNQQALLATLYDARFTVSNATAAWFMLGCWMRIASWVFLFGLFAAHRTKLIIVGELFSLPLYALLLWLFSNGMTLERAAFLSLVSYVTYFTFNAAALLNFTGKPKSILSDARSIP